MSVMESSGENVIIVMAGGSSASPIERSLTPCPSPEYGRGEPIVAETAPERSLPPLAAQATNLFQSVVAFVGDGCALVDEAEYRQRLETCRVCDRRHGKRCTACGCWIALKARGRAFSCPLGTWIVMQFDGTGTAALTAANLSHRYFWRPAVDQLLADEQVTNSDLLVWALGDNENTVRDLAAYSNGVTTVVNHRVFSAYGEIASQTNPATNTAAAVDCLFAYTGRPVDTATGLQNNDNRWYNAIIGRWLSQDPLGLGPDSNPYRYCGNGPADATDPRGTQYIDPKEPLPPPGGIYDTGRVPVGPNRELPPNWDSNPMKIPENSIPPIQAIPGGGGLKGVPVPPQQPAPPVSGGWSVGLVGGPSAEAGIISGTSVQVSQGAGYFSNDGVGTFTTRGAYAGCPAGGVSAVQNPNPNGPNNPGNVTGVSAGVSGQLYVANTGSIGNITGTFTSLNFTFFFVSVQFQSGKDPNGKTVWMASAGINAGLGLSVSTYPTYTTK
jgi:RHS repeat-associated protein